jgi:hypothetical protein
MKRGRSFFERPPIEGKSDRKPGVITTDSDNTGTVSIGAGGDLHIGIGSGLSIGSDGLGLQIGSVSIEL